MSIPPRMRHAPHRCDKGLLLLLTLLLQRDLFGMVNIHLTPNQESNHTQDHWQKAA